MNRILLVLCFTILSFTVSAQTGTEFWFAAPEISEGMDLDRPIAMIFTTYDDPADIVIAQPAGGGMPDQTLSLPANSTQRIMLTDWIEDIETKPTDAILDYGLKITATSTIAAYYEVVTGTETPGSERLNPEVFVLKGSNALGTDFLIPSQDLLSNGSAYSPTPYNAFIIIATEDNTTVTINPAKDISGHTAGTPFDILLDEGQVYAATAVSQAATAHLAGSLVSSDKPIAITVSDDLVSGAIFGGCADLGGDQIVPTSKLGTEYIAMDGELNSPGSYIFVTAMEDGTSIQKDGTVIATIDAQETHSFPIAGASTYIETSQPTVVWQVSGIGCEVGMAILPQIDCSGSYSVSYTRSQPHQLYVNVFTAAGGEDDFTVNGSATVLTAAMFDPVPGTGGDWLAAIVLLPVADYPEGAVIKVENSTNKFHMGVLDGSGSGGATFGYFSDFGSGGSFNASANEVCVGDTLTLQAGGIAEYYEWTGPGGFTSDLQNPMIADVSTIHAGMYYVASENSCGLMLDSVYVNIDVPISFSLGDDRSLCEGGLVTLSTPVGEDFTYLWNTGSTAPSINVSSNGVYTLVVTNGACTSSDTVAVTFTQDAGITIKFDEDFLYKCREDSLIIEPSITPAGVYTYQWTPEASFLPPGSANIIYYGDTAINLKLRVTNADGCYNVDSVDIKVFDPRPIVVGPVDTGVCPGGSVTIVAEGGVKYQWIPSMYLDSDTAAIVTATPLTSTNYVLLAEDINGCTYQKEVDIAVYSNAVVSLPDSVTIYSGESVEMPMESNCLYFSWFPPSGLSSTLIGNPIAQPEVRTRYFVNASTEHGCITADSIDVLVKGEVIDIPNAFVPGNHSNPVFKPVARGIVQLNGFKIFNRWGNLVFETTDINRGWDGTFNGNTQPVGVYVYTIEATTASGNRFVKQGNVTLLR